MFYSEFVLTKKGPLAKIWLAAHWDRKLNKNQITETDIKDSVNSIVNPVVAIALRTSGHLLLGVVKIYQRKVKYVLAEANEALTKIKLQVIPDTKVDLPEKNTMATFSSITLPDKGANIQLLLPDVEFINPNENLRVVDFGEITMDDFEQWETAPETQARPSQGGPPSVSDKTPSVEIPREQQLFPEMPDDFGIVDQIMGETPGKKTPQIGRISEIPEEPFGISPGIETTFDIPTEEPLKKKRKLVSKGKLIIDEETSIPSAEFKAQISNSSDTLRVLKLAPKTKEELSETPLTFTVMLNQPNISGLPSSFTDLYSKKRMREDLNEKEQVREQPGFEDVPDAYMPQPSPTDGGFDLPDIQHELITPERTVRPSIGGTHDLPSTTTKKKKQKTAETEEERQAREELAKEYKGKGITDKTLKVLGLLKESFKDKDELSVDAMLLGRKKAVAGKYFFELLVLKSKGIINAEQDEPFGDIILSKTQQFV